MRITDVKRLHSGDEVYWEDPDNGLCSDFVRIKEIEFIPPNFVRIMSPDGFVLECFARELK